MQTGRDLKAMKLIEQDRATYSIRVRGRLGAEWSERLQGMTLVVDDTQDARPVTDISGAVDQAALMGVLQQLYSLGAEVLSVGRLDSSSAGELAAAHRLRDGNESTET